MAVLFATSCSKDDVDNTVKTPQEIVQENVDNTINDNVETPQEIVQENVDNTINDNVETPQEIVQENVDNTINDIGESPQEIAQENDDNTVKTITITGKVSQESLSKVSLANNNKTLQFDGGEIFEFGIKDSYTAGDVWGEITIKDEEGKYEAKLYFKGEGDNLVGEEAVFTAELNSDPDVMSDGFEDDEGGESGLIKAVRAAYYTIDFKVKRVPNDPPSTGYTYKLRKNDDENSDIVVNLKSAFIHATTSRDIKVNNDTQQVEEGKYYVLSSTAKMGSGTQVVAGKIYKVTTTP